MTLGHEFRIETERLILRPRREGDREANWLWMQDDEVMRYLPRQPRAEADERFDKQVALQAAQDHCFWVVERKADGKAIGFCGIVPPRPPLHEYEIGWRLIREAWGLGLATEAARATLAWAWENLAINTIVAITVPANTASWRVMERIGMTRNPADDFDHPDLPEGDRLRPHILYRITRERLHA